MSSVLNCSLPRSSMSTSPVIRSPFFNTSTSVLAANAGAATSARRAAAIARTAARARLKGKDGTGGVYRLTAVARFAILPRRRAAPRAPPRSDSLHELAQRGGTLAERGGEKRRGGFEHAHGLDVVLLEQSLDAVDRRAKRVRGTGLDVCALLEPAQQVGGDLYEVLRLPGGRVMVALGDVSGKGIPAALFMGIHDDAPPQHGTPVSAARPARSRDQRGRRKHAASSTGFISGDAPPPRPGRPFTA